MHIPSLRVLRFVIGVMVIASVAATAFAQIPNSTWVQLNPKHSPPRRGAWPMAYDPVSREIVM